MGALPMPKEKAFSARATTLNYLDCGSPTAEPLVLLHGGAWRWQEYLSLIPSLSRKWHTCAMDLRGHGGSQWVPETYRLRDFVEDNAQFLGTLNSPAILVGHSLGGVVALMLAARCPDKVKALVIHDVPLVLDNYRRVVDSSREVFALWLKRSPGCRRTSGMRSAR